ncbi:hypothetical protein B0T10DRAFT_20675 [Thelonectria olida]|uniref:Uncharacterized protein n=1 Tax=Thelonectria olida TaxID=1576542 RepID=A0A9P9ATU6_9HYPO|nr:hypothetical protein B0T10DRAFT_20675 [Thelonectria olida]
MMLHGAQSPSSGSPVAAAVAPAVGAHAADGLNQQTRLRRRKRKADTQDNERLSKRLSLLNLEKSGNKLYVPVETPSPPTTTATAPNHGFSSTSTSSSAPVADDTMQLDDTKHKVYIYNIDDELSSDSDSDDTKLVFLPDIEKHLRANRIPPSILANKDGELAGMQVVLYSDPKSLSVPEGKDSVRKAILESRHRVREQQRLQREGKTIDPPIADNATNDTEVPPRDYDSDAMDMD